MNGLDCWTVVAAGIVASQGFGTDCHVKIEKAQSEVGPVIQ